MSYKADHYNWPVKIRVVFYWQWQGKQAVLYKVAQRQSYASIRQCTPYRPNNHPLLSCGWIIGDLARPFAHLNRLLFQFFKISMH